MKKLLAIAHCLGALDVMLTGKCDNSAYKMSSMEEDLSKGLRYTYYLSDGGFSRLYIDIDDIHPTVVLGSESRDEVRNVMHQERVGSLMRELRALLYDYRKWLESQSQ
jgi:hypothetical protein